VAAVRQQPRKPELKKNACEKTPLELLHRVKYINISQVWHNAARSWYFCSGIGIVLVVVVFGGVHII
jgi:hypothetical protein